MRPDGSQSTPVGHWLESHGLTPVPYRTPLHQPFPAPPPLSRTRPYPYPDPSLTPSLPLFHPFPTPPLPLPLPLPLPHPFPTPPIAPPHPPLAVRYPSSFIPSSNSKVHNPPLPASFLPCISPPSTFALSPDPLTPLILAPYCRVLARAPGPRGSGRVHSVGATADLTTRLLGHAGRLTPQLQSVGLCLAWLSYSGACGRVQAFGIGGLR